MLRMLRARLAKSRGQTVQRFRLLAGAGNLRASPQEEAGRLREEEKTLCALGSPTKFQTKLVT